jgi:hypothetical protein
MMRRSAISLSAALPAARRWGEAGFASLLTPRPGVVEIREYTLKPEGMVAFLKQQQAAATLRRSVLPLLGWVRMQCHPAAARVLCCV